MTNIYDAIVDEALALQRSARLAAERTDETLGSFQRVAQGNLVTLENLVDDARALLRPDPSTPAHIRKYEDEEGRVRYSPSWIHEYFNAVEKNWERMYRQRATVRPQPAGA